MVDIIRPERLRKKRGRRIAWTVLVIAVLGGITLALRHLQAPVPTLDRATLWIDTVRRGDLIRKVRGFGKLVPREVRWVTAMTDGRVTRIGVLPGTSVKADTVLLELTNPEAIRELRDAELKLRVATAEYQSLRVELENQLLNQRAVIADLKSQYQAAKLRADADAQLLKDHLVSNLQAQLSRTRAETLHQRIEIERQRLDHLKESIQARLEAQRARIEQLRSQVDMHRRRVAALRVRAGIDGVLQEIRVQVGQQVTPGMTLAIVANTQDLRAQLKIPQNQVRDVQVGQSALIDVHGQTVKGHVIRIDPLVRDGTVTVDVELDEPLPRGARPDLSIEGTITLEVLKHVLYVGHPALVTPEQTVNLFRLDPDGHCATRVRVRLGASSVQHVEVREGLKEGDRIILSDMSAWQDQPRVCLK